MNRTVDTYLKDGCGRCDLVGTPYCKALRWLNELTHLRKILLDCGLTEELKWGVPCYTHNGANIVLMSAFKEYCALSFFKGALLKNPNGILIQQTDNTQATRQIRFTHIQAIIEMEGILKAYLNEAIEVEKTGLTVTFKKIEEFDISQEFQKKLDELPTLKTAFEALTPVRQKAYLLYFAAPKQSKTRESRIKKHIPQIFNDKGLHD